MKVEILRCPICKTYTLNKICKTCSSKTITSKPPKYSPEDKYGYYRRLYKEKNIKN